MLGMISRIYVMPARSAAKADSYLVDSKLSASELERLARSLTNPILEQFFINESPKLLGFSHAIEIGFLPGVTDNVGHTVKEIAKDMFGLKENSGLEVYTSKLFFVSGSLEDTQKMAATLYKPLIERALIVPVEKGKINLGKKAPQVVLHKRKPVKKVSLSVGEEELVKIGTQGIEGEDGKRR